jgi:hypothetical protein
MRFLVIGLILGLGFSGCVDATEPAVGTAQDPGPLFEAGSGAIDGFVVDASLAPLEGAQVGVLALGKIATTGADGSFLLRGVPAGRHELAAQKLGYASAGAAVDVKEGERASITLRLEAIPVAHPYYQILVERGSFGCGIAYRPQQAGIVGASICGAITAYVGPNQVDKFLIYWTLVGPYDAWMGAAYEMEWTTTQALGSGLWVRFETDGCSGSIPSQFVSLRGRSPLREVQDAATVAEKLANNEASNCGSADNCSPTECRFHSRVFPHTEVLGDAYPADIGVTFQQPFTQYFTQFFHAEPAPEYSALADS